MTTHIKSNAMDIDSDHSDSVESNSRQVSYVNDYENLPSNGPTNHAHIVDLSDFVDFVKEDGMVKLQDAVVTTLYNTSPDTLKLFLSPTVNTIKAMFGKKDSQLVIWRKGLEVFVGTFENHKSMKSFRFEHVAGFLIGYDGSWHLKVIASDAYCTNKWPDVWAGKFEDRGGITKMTVEADEESMAKSSSILAKYILTSKCWERIADVKTT